MLITEGLGSCDAEDRLKEEIAYYETELLIEQCKQYKVAPPTNDSEDGGTYWKETEFFLANYTYPLKIFTDKAFEELTVKILKRRTENLSVITTVITTLIGLVGVLLRFQL